MSLQWYGVTYENRNFEYKEDKATMQILNLNTKSIESKHFIHSLPQTISADFVRLFCNASTQ